MGAEIRLRGSSCCRFGWLLLSFFIGYYIRLSLAGCCPLLVLIYSKYSVVVEEKQFPARDPPVGQCGCCTVVGRTAHSVGFSFNFGAEMVAVFFFSIFFSTGPRPVPLLSELFMSKVVGVGNGLGRMAGRRPVKVRDDGAKGIWLFFSDSSFIVSQLGSQFDAFSL